jgi:glycosyltransferase involved in cell wall biosynthesis
LIQKGRGKGDAVRLGFSHASGDILMILDADLSVAPEDLPQFYNALVSGRGEFIKAVKDTLCGTKVLYPSDYKRIAKDRAYFGDFDPFGDFDLLFGAAT